MKIGRKILEIIIIAIPVLCALSMVVICVLVESEE